MYWFVSTRLKFKDEQIIIKILGRYDGYFVDHLTLINIFFVENQIISFFS